MSMKARHANLEEVLAKARESGAISAEECEETSTITPPISRGNQLHRLLARSSDPLGRANSRDSDGNESHATSSHMHVRAWEKHLKSSRMLECPICREAFQTHHELDRHVQEELRIAMEGESCVSSDAWWQKEASKERKEKNHTISIGSKPTRKNRAPRLKKKRAYFNHYEEMKQSIADASSLSIQEGTSAWECGIGTWNLGPNLE